MSLDDGVLAAAQIDAWTDEADVIVVGLGAAGLSAAIEALASGARVLGIERASGPGGTTLSAAGHVYMGGGTPVQQAVGVADDAEQMFRYLMANTPVPDEHKIRAYCEDSLAHFDWLEAQGVPFNRTMYTGKHVVQPTDECLIESGNEKAWPYCERAKPAARGHKVARAGEAGGSLLIERLSARAMQLGLRMLSDAAVRHLVADESGRIVGLAYRRDGVMAYAKARRGVVLAAGAFSMNNEMLQQYCPALADERIYKLGNPHDDGAGIRLGLAAGGEAVHMDGYFVTSAIYPDESLIKGILVNGTGERFVAEDGYHSRTTAAMANQPEGRCYLIVDAACHGQPQIINHPLIDAWESVSEMERALQIPTGNLQRTLAEYNDHAQQGVDPEFHKQKPWLQPLVNAPWGAFDCSLGKTVYLGFTLGGLRTSIDAEVLSEQGDPVPGLYAAGACASNIAQDSTGYSSGTCLGEATYFGRRAGRCAAQAEITDLGEVGA